MTSAQQTLSDNVRLIRERMQINREQEWLCVEQLVNVLLQDEQQPRPHAIYERFKALLGYELDCSTVLHFSTALANGLQKRGLPLATASFSQSNYAIAPGSHEKIALVRNHYNDNAFSHFSDLLPHAKASYYGDFYECCDAVLKGECEFSILPLENTADGRLFRFYSMLERYELRIRSACDLESHNAMSTVRYALVARNPELPSPITDSTPCFLEIDLTYREDQSISDVFDAAKHYGISVYRTDTLTISYEDERIRHYHSFTASDEDALMRFLLFLHVRFPQFNLLGLYHAV